MTYLKQHLGSERLGVLPPVKLKPELPALTVVEGVGRKLPPKKILGMRIGRRIVESYAGVSKRGIHRWLMRCDCGNASVVQENQILYGIDSLSCGCFSSELKSERHQTHGATNTKEYTAWANMKARCLRPGHPCFRYYGGRGIKICERWGIFENFVKDMGKCVNGKHTLERINNEGHYEPNNCRWSTRIDQQNNRRGNHLITIHGITRTAAQWERHNGLNHGTIASRLYIGWSAERAATTPIKSKLKPV